MYDLVSGYLLPRVWDGRHCISLGTREEQNWADKLRRRVTQKHFTLRSARLWTPLVTTQGIQPLQPTGNTPRVDHLGVAPPDVLSPDTVPPTHCLGDAPLLACARMRK